ncbi:hypothetical protein PG985_013984 [Apiospora marii]|uniref:uncharacterized protein n=1 Tax=Apiospora marii TaxID=335849 RepID=UPI00312F819C
MEYEKTTRETHEQLSAENDGLALPAFPTSLAEQVPARGVNGAILLTFLDNGNEEKISGCASELPGEEPPRRTPLGILKVGLLNYWWARKEQDEPEHFPSLARYLVYFGICLGRAVYIGTVFPNDPVEFSREAYRSDEASLSGSCALPYKVKDTSIDSELCMKLLDQKHPQRLRYLLTADLQGAGNIHADPKCCIMKEYIGVEGADPPPRERQFSPRTPAAGQSRPADPSRGAAGARRPNVSKRIPEIPPSIVEEPSDAPRLQEALAKLRNCAGLVIQVKGKVDKFREMRVPGVKAALERLEKGLKTQMANGRKVRDAYLDLGGDTNQVPSVLREDKTPAEGETVQDQKTANPIKEGPSPDAKNSAPKPPVKAAGAEDKAPESPVIEVTKAAHPEPRAGIPATPLNKEEPPAVVPDHSTTNHGDQGDDTVKPTADPLTQTHQEKDATAQKPGAPVFDLPGDDTVASDADATKLDGSRKDPVQEFPGSDLGGKGDDAANSDITMADVTEGIKTPSLLKTPVPPPPDKDLAAARSDSPKLAPEAKDTVDVNPDPNRQGNDGVQQEARAPEVGVPLPDVMQGIEPPAAAAGSKVPKADLLGKDTVAVKAVPQT